MRKMKIARAAFACLVMKILIQMSGVFRFWRSVFRFWEISNPLILIELQTFC